MLNDIASRLKSNWKSGVTVSLVSIPLSVSLAVASESTPLAGIITGIWAGLVAAIFGGSNFNVVGPTGALSGIIAAFALTNGVSTLASLAVVTGCFIIVAYLIRLERYLIFIPSSVIHGFTLGVAFIIGLNQLNYALGLHGLVKHEKFIANVFESLRHLNSASSIAIALFFVFLIGLFALKRLTPKFPGAIVLSPIGIMVGYLATRGTIPFSLETLGSKFGSIGAQLIVWPHLSFNMALIGTGATVAVIAILETMLSAKIADGMTKTKHNERKEMLGLGLANIASGLVGGIPATAALARTSLNIKTSATHRTSGIINSLSMAIISLLLLSYFQYIPMAVIASILVYTAVQMVETNHFKKFFAYDKSSFVISLLVAGVTIYEDPIIGILFGTALSLIIFVEKLSRGQFELVLNTYEKGAVSTISGEDLKTIEENHDILLYSIKGKLAFINSRAHVSRFESTLKNYKEIIIRLREVYFMDLDGIEALDEIIDIVHSRGQRVLLTGVSQHLQGLLEQNSKGYQKLKKEGLVFDKASEALNFLGIDHKQTTYKNSAKLAAAI